MTRLEHANMSLPEAIHNAEAQTYGRVIDASFGLGRRSSNAGTTLTAHFPLSR